MMNPWFGEYNQLPVDPFSFFMHGPPQGFPFHENPFNQGPTPYPQHPMQQPSYPQQQFPQPGQPFPQSDPFAMFKTKDGNIDFNKVNSSIQQVMGVASQIGPIMKTFGLIK